MILRASLIAFLSLGFVSQAAVAKDLTHDAEHYVLLAQNAEKWATTDTFTISYQHENSPKQTAAKDVSSTNLVTASDVSIPLKKGEITKIFYERSGSLGVAGFASGRTIEVVWDGS